NDYPNVAGIYELAGTFDDLPADQITGTLTLVQPDRTSGNFGGSIVASVSSADVTINSGLPSISTVSKSGLVNFVVSNGTASWVFNGTLTGNVISGRHTLSDATSSFSGSWTATR